MSRKPRIYAHCDAGCNWETIHRDEFLRSASHVEIYPNQNGFWNLVIGKTYKIFADKDENGAFAFELRIDYFGGSYYVKTATNDKYADYFIFTLLEYSNNDDGGITLVYEIEGNRYTETIDSANVYAADGYIILYGANTVYMYNADATVVARDGADGVGSEDKEARQSIELHLQAHEDGRFDELPVVELTTPVDNGTTFTAEENAALAAALATGKPVIVKSTIMETPSVVMVMNNFAGQGFVAVYANYNFLLMDTGEGWSALIEEMRVLPEVTEDDEGKFVQVVGGAYALVAAQTYIAVATEEEATDTEAIPINDGQVIVVTGE